MKKITFEEFCCIMSCDISEKQNCIEIEFSVDNCDIYQSSWLGKMIDEKTKEDSYWHGLTPDGSQAYDYDSFEKFVNVKIIFGRSIKEIWDSITIISIDASDVQERVSDYLEMAKSRESDD